MSDPQPTSPQVPPPEDMDVSLVRWMLGLSPEERLAVLQGFVDSVAELRDGSAPPV